MSTVATVLALACLLSRSKRLRGRFSVLLLLLAWIPTACSPAPDLEAERAAIATADSAWLAAVQAGDLETTLGFWTEDARVIPPGQPALVGHDAIRGMLDEAFGNPEFSVTWHTDAIVVAPSGEFAYSLGTNAFTVPNPDGGMDTLRGTGVVVWRKGADGRWRSEVDIWTPSPLAKITPATTGKETPWIPRPESSS